MQNENMLNYMALLACIISPYKISIDTSIRSITLQKLNNNKPKTKEEIEKARELGKSRRKKTLVIDTYTNNKYEFESGYDAAKFLGMYHTSVSQYLKEGRMYKKRYTFRKM